MLNYQRVCPYARKYPSKVHRFAKNPQPAEPPPTLLPWARSKLGNFILCPVQIKHPLETTGISILYAYNFLDLFGTIKWGCWLLGGWDSSNGWRVNAMTRLSSKQWFAVQYNRSWDAVLASYISRVRCKQLYLHLLTPACSHRAKHLS